MQCHEFKGVTYHQDHQSRFLHANYTKLFKQILHYSSENLISSVIKHSKTTALKYIKVVHEGGVAVCRKARGKNQANSQSSVPVQVQNLLHLEWGKHTL